MDDGRDIFASLIGAAKTPAPAVKPERVTTATIAKVREAQAVEAAERAFDEKLEAVKAEKAALEGEKTALKEEIATLNLAIASIAADKETLKEQLDGVRGELRAAKAAADDLEELVRKLRKDGERLAEENRTLSLEVATLKSEPRMDPAVVAENEERAKEIERLKSLLGEAHRTSLSSTVLLEKPYAVAEKFPGEVREHVISTLAEAQRAADGGGRERRSKILEAVLMSNPSDGELDRRREAVKRILLGASNGFIGEREISELVKLGFRSIGAGKHHKLLWADIPFTVSKTPGDKRALMNSAQTLNRAF